MRVLITILTALVAATAIASAVPPPRPTNYPRSYDDLIASAEREGTLTVYSNIDTPEAAPVLDGFRRRYPGIRLVYVDLPANELFRRFVSETDARKPSADLLVSSAMDLQIKLINDGYAQTYASPEKPALPPAAVWKNQGYGITAEPIAIAYNRKLLPDARAPRTHAALTAWLVRERARLQGRVATFDPARSGVGYLYLQQDLATTLDTWSLLGALAATKPLLSNRSEDMIDGVASGHFVLAYNVIGSYALERARHAPELGVIFPSDYTLTMSRIGLIPAQAPHPSVAKLFLDYLLSRPGQTLLAQRSLSPIRPDVGAAISRPTPAGAAPIRVGPQLLANLDPIKHQHFLRRWAKVQKQN